MSDVTNLNRFRKRVERDKQAKKADANRARFEGPRRNARQMNGANNGSVKFTSSIVSRAGTKHEVAGG